MLHHSPLRTSTFENMRIGFAHLIKSSSSNVNLTNLDFYNIFTFSETLYIEKGGKNSFTY